MQITLRGKTYTAEHLTDLNALPLMALGLDNKGNPVQDLQAMMGALVDPQTIATLARSLSAIFPSLPKELVSYSRDTFTFNLNLNELLQAVTLVCTELQADQPETAIAPVVDVAPVEVTEEVSSAKWERLGNLRQQIVALESLEDFEGKALQLDHLKTEEEIIAQELGGTTVSVAK